MNWELINVGGKQLYKDARTGLKVLQAHGGWQAGGVGEIFKTPWEAMCRAEHKFHIAMGRCPIEALRGTSNKAQQPLRSQLG